jgi:hypothetical protein
LAFGMGLEYNIRSGQAFFVQTTASSTLIFKNSMRILSNNTDGGFYRTSMVSDAIKLVLNDGENQKAAIVGFADDATIGYDRSYDTTNLSQTGMLLYSIQSESGKRLGIQGLPQGYKEQIQLGFSTEVEGSYTISLANISELVVSPKDLLTGIVVNLKDESYSVSTSATFDETRFTL